MKWRVQSLEAGAGAKSRWGGGLTGAGVKKWSTPGQTPGLLLSPGACQ